MTHTLVNMTHTLIQFSRMIKYFKIKNELERIHQRNESKIS